LEGRRAALNIPNGWHRKSEATGNMKRKEMKLDTDESRDEISAQRYFKDDDLNYRQDNQNEQMRKTKN
jgi:hypothetical protein